MVDQSGSWVMGTMEWVQHEYNVRLSFRAKYPTNHVRPDDN